MGQGRHTLRSVSDPVYPHVARVCLSLTSEVEDQLTMVQLSRSLISCIVKSNGPFGVQYVILE